MRRQSNSRSTALRRIRAAALASALALAGLAVSAAASAPPASVTIGGRPLTLSAATAVGGVAPTSRLALTLVLKSRDPAGLSALAAAVASPSSPSFHHYLTVAQFAARFGADPASVAALRVTLRGYGLHPGALAADGLSLPVSGSASDASRAFDVRLRRYRTRSGARLYSNTAAPRLPAALGSVVTDVLGLSNTPAAVPEGLARLPSKPAAKTAAAPAARAAGAGGAPAACAQASSFQAANTRFFTLDQIAKAYGFSSLYTNGDLGQGVTVALPELDPYASTAVAQTDIATFQQCYGTAAKVTVEPLVDGGPTEPLTPTAESAVDLENVIGLAPQANVDVYEGPNTGQGNYDTLATILERDSAQVISDSWGLCEQEDPIFSQIELNLLYEAAIQGESFLAAAGDRGAEGCASEWNDNLTNIPQQGGDTNAPSLAVDDPASQPYATGVGGTNLTALGPPPVQTAWDHLYWGASGGGISTLWQMPNYQLYAGVPGVLNSYSSVLPCQKASGQTSGYCREVPDVSVDGSTETGYVTFYDGGWTAFGGTSTATPVWAALIALADSSGLPGCSSPAAAATRLGFLNPLLYEVAAGDDHADAFDDITVGDNSGYFGATNPYGSYPSGPYPATPGYDMASGLGTPIATDGSSPGLVAQLCTANATQLSGAPAVSGLGVSEASPGSTITVNGSGFTRYTAVWFGGVVAASVDDISPTQLLATVPQGSGVVDVTVTDLAGWSTTAAADVFTYSPTETIVSPASGAVYGKGQTVAAAYSCVAFGAGPSACSGPVASGAAIDTSTPGVHEFTVTATDANGFATATTATYTVVSALSGVPAPSITITGPAAGGVYAQGRALKARFSCSAAAPVTITACTGTVAAGATVSTSSPGTRSFVVAATDSEGATSTTTVSYTVVAALPKITSLQETASQWLERPSKGLRLPLGTTFSFALDQSARVKLSFTRLANGRVAAGRCVPPTLAGPRARRCTRGLSAGTVTLAAAPGANSVSFAGKTSTGRLPPGTYTVVLHATGLSGRASTALALLFTIAAPKR
jgi:hypothetical protein